MKIIKIELNNPFYLLKIFFLYNPIFWKLIEIKYHKNYPTIYLIRHIITGKIVSHSGWGKTVTQNSIFNCNGRFDLQT